MNGRIRRGLWAGLCVLGIGVSSAAAQPAVPANLEVPAGHSVFLVGHASGTQRRERVSHLRHETQVLAGEWVTCAEQRRMKRGFS